jgi:hypothetical protein
MRTAIRGRRPRSSKSKQFSTKYLRLLPDFVTLAELPDRLPRRDLQSKYRRRIKSDCTVMNLPVPPTAAVRRRQIVEERIDE